MTRPKKSLDQTLYKANLFFYTNEYLSCKIFYQGVLGPRMHHLILNRSMAPSTMSRAQQLLAGLQATGDESRQLQVGFFGAFNLFM